MHQLRVNGRFAKKSRIDQINKSKSALKKYNDRVKRKLNEQNECEEKQKCCIEGSRVIDLSYLAEQMFCKVCNERLSLPYIKREVKRGFASIFHIECENCHSATEVYSSRKSASDGGNPLFNVNSKAALGE